MKTKTEKRFQACVRAIKLGHRNFLLKAFDETVKYLPQNLQHELNKLREEREK